MQLKNEETPAAVGSSGEGGSTFAPTNLPTEQRNVNSKTSGTRMAVATSIGTALTAARSLMSGS